MPAPPVDWPTVVRMHGPMAFDVAWRLLGHAADTEDAVQEALLDAFRLHAREPVHNWGAVLRHLATRRAIDRLRRRRLRGTGRTDDGSAGGAEPFARPSEQPESVAIERELAQRLREAIADLPDREASVFSLAHFGRLSNPEIAATLGITPDAVAVALHKARQRLRERLADEPAGRLRP